MPVKTHIIPLEKRKGMEEFIKSETDKGYQVFHIVPRIDSAADTDEDIRDIESVASVLSEGCLGSVSMKSLHGRLSVSEKESVMAEFSEGKIKILIATTVLEVGIDVPNATVMVIENADRFGLSTLHQLRGRVGRSDLKSYCFLPFNKSEKNDVIHRLKKFCETSDGFDIADLDLSLRGPGEVSGFRQSGFSELQFADIMRDMDLFHEIQDEIDALLPRNNVGEC